MNINIENIDINYELSGDTNTETVIILHGWGANLKTFAPVSKYLSKKYKVYSIDLPGFGESSEPDSTYNVSSYANVVLNFIKVMDINNPTLIGHSFGGRVIMKMVGEFRLYSKKYNICR